MDRDKTIDAYRGLAILGMIFFTVTLRLSSDLPEVIRHNSWGSVHLGDFILPMFLFASGLSLAFYIQCKEKVDKKLFLRDVLLRFSKLALVGILLSIFSAYGFLEMDEVMLSALLFIACVALSKLNLKVIIGIVFFINLSYIVLMQFDLISIFMGHYLGGYPAALYYLPIMLTGLVIGKGIILKGLWCGSNQTVVWMTFIFFLLFLIFIPLNKMTATPSFMLLSTLFSFGIFAVMELILTNKIGLRRLEYIGRKPLRYWLMMYIFFLIPLWLYIELFGLAIPLNITWYISILISVGLMVLLYIFSYLFEYVNI